MPAVAVSLALIGKSLQRASNVHNIISTIGQKSAGVAQMLQFIELIVHTVHQPLHVSHFTLSAHRIVLAIVTTKSKNIRAMIKELRR